VTNELIARICQSFVALESLELLFGNIQIQYPTILESFQQEIPCILSKFHKQEDFIFQPVKTHSII